MQKEKKLHSMQMLIQNLNVNGMNEASNYSTQPDRVFSLILLRLKFWEAIQGITWGHQTTEEVDFFTSDIWTCCSRKITGATNNINNVSVVFRCPSKSWRCGSDPAWTWTLIEKQLNGIQPLLSLLLFTCVLFLLSDMMSYMYRDLYKLISIGIKPS